MTVPAYPAYRESGVEWIGAVPPTWQIIPLKHVVSMQSGEQITAERIEDEGGFPVYGGNGLRGYTTAFTHDGHFALIGRQGALCGNINYANGQFWASEHAVVATPRVPCAVRWLGELLRAMDLGQYSVTAAQPGLSVEAVGNLRIPLPPPAEQTAIAAFLDRETGKIDTLVAEQERLIALLKEKRQAVISQAVTKGLDASAPMKDSGVAWLGQVPAHWEVTRLGRVTATKCDGPFGSGLKSEHYTECGVRVIRLQNIRMGHFDDTDAAFIDEEYFRVSLPGHDVQEGDLLIAGLGDDRNIVGRCCVAPAGVEPAMVKADCFRFRLFTQHALPAFMAMQLTAGSQFDAGMMSSGSTRSRIPLSVMATRSVALPPLAEQQELVEEIEARSRDFDTLTNEAHHAIALLRERRAALISAAVTGKIDVRGLELSAEVAAA